jgi:6,7-dimethyl-8-ribityllumazine synthase
MDNRDLYLDYYSKNTGKFVLYPVSYCKVNALSFPASYNMIYTTKGLIKVLSYYGFCQFSAVITGNFIKFEKLQKQATNS